VVFWINLVLARGNLVFDTKKAPAKDRINLVLLCAHVMVDGPPCAWQSRFLGQPALALDKPRFWMRLAGPERTNGDQSIRSS
jgi:hypothetical protein